MQNTVFSTWKGSGTHLKHNMKHLAVATLNVKEGVMKTSTHPVYLSSSILWGDSAWFYHCRLTTWRDFNTRYKKHLIVFAWGFNVCISTHFKVSKFLYGDPEHDLTSDDGDKRAALMKMDYSWEPIMPTNLSSSSPERREAGAGREVDRDGERDRNKWSVATMTRSRGDHRGFHPHLSLSLHLQSPLADVHNWTPEGKMVSQGPRGPTMGQSFSQSLYAHTDTHTIPILIPYTPLTSLLKHRSKSPDWSQWLRNKWCQIPDFCMAFSAKRHEGCIHVGHFTKKVSWQKMQFATISLRSLGT